LISCAIGEAILDAGARDTLLVQAADDAHDVLTKGFVAVAFPPAAAVDVDDERCLRELLCQQLEEHEFELGVADLLEDDVIGDLQVGWETGGAGFGGECGQRQ